MKHIKALNEYINQTLTFSEKEYLIDLLQEGLHEGEAHDKQCLPATREAEEMVQIKPEFYTLSKRVIKYGVIQKKLLIQKPKTLLKLINSVKQIGQGDGGFSVSTVDNIIENLVQNSVLKIDSSENVEWLK